MKGTAETQKIPDRHHKASQEKVRKADPNYHADEVAELENLEEAEAELDLETNETDEYDDGKPEEINKEAVSLPEGRTCSRMDLQN